MIQLGHYPPPMHTIAHFSDPHFLGSNRPMFGRVDNENELSTALSRLEASGIRPEAIVFTGDLTDLGEPDAYQRLRSIVEPAADRMGAIVVWVMGNHDERLAFRRGLLDEPAEAEGGEAGDGKGGMAPLDRVFDLGGLRIVVLDTSVPGYNHGALEDSQLAWLDDVLSTHAPEGTLLAMHHPPIPSPIELMAVLELQRQDRLAEVVRGRGVRGILAGHLHYQAHSTFAGIPVSVASATCYTLDPAGPPNELAGLAGGRSFGLVQLYRDTVVHATVQAGLLERVSGFGSDFVEGIASLTPEQRLEAFSNKESTFSIEEVEQRARAARSDPPSQN